MPTPVTETSTFSATVVVPNDGNSEAVNQAAVLAYTQPLTNRTKYLKDHLDAAEGDIDDLEAGLAATNLAVIAKLTPSASALADAGKLGLSVHLGYPSGDWNVTSDELQVPSAGLYRIALHTPVSVGSTSNPDAAVIHVRVGASGIVAWFVGERFSASASDAFTVRGEVIVPIGTPATEKIWLRNESGTTLTTVDFGADNDMVHSLIVERIGDL
jgi:hypothetical protein